LTLARASDDAAIVREPVDLALVAERELRRSERDGKPLAGDASFASAIVEGDERRLGELVANLVGNARRYARTRITVRVASEGDVALLVVGDDGPGVAPDLVPHLFERFAKTPDSPGSGLGLAICRWIVAAHGGTIDYADGSEFIVRLPLANRSAS
ncbi:MAG: sensor histidine kinase, partial [Vulcanimicrobiaceae bacterium]